jgi:hypothetical protein
MGEALFLIVLPVTEPITRFILERIDDSGIVYIVGVGFSGKTGSPEI